MPTEDEYLKGLQSEDIVLLYPESENSSLNDLADHIKANLGCKPCVKDGKFPPLPQGM